MKKFCHEDLESTQQLGVATHKKVQLQLSASTIFPSEYESIHDKHQRFVHLITFLSPPVPVGVAMENALLSKLAVVVGGI